MTHAKTLSIIPYAHAIAPTPHHPWPPTTLLSIDGLFYIKRGTDECGIEDDISAGTV